ncbi:MULTISPECIES: class I SAM-dependent methyltransferase [unclassified Amycolatopsis]|uniref:class I SAM-dependent methyltransferase n=1 Tax=unclassified Amycolatopsis TaxID=2618356 RepID=UPI001FF2D0A0|nr:MULTISPECIES: class I SAM-dependent methyltransferase [unclassified Amycolatopsis]UOZ06704.1 class I SAM-dependent methyltransferase [Amycolatopsis sp. WQ 127309]WSJ73005.1 class I SAM-dependent methyltransferase [Amycolatopsis sp. NBC_01307]WSK83268.1 class I SAM-dependent methyltransferase [Amycolatopsis sp. NBC_01286]
MTDRDSVTPSDVSCRVCGGQVEEFLDLGSQPVSQRFRTPEDTSGEFFFRLAVGHCTTCTMVQLVEEVPREEMFHEDYPFTSSGSRYMTEYFSGVARDFLETELAGDDPFIVEIGSNDGVMLGTIRDAGVRHLGFEPSGHPAEMARAAGIRVRGDFFEESTARETAAADGPADVIYSANTICHIPYLDSIFRGVDALLAPNGVFVFEDPYLGDIVAKRSFDQIYDEHFYLFSARSVRAAANRFGFDLVDVRRLPVHGGEVRYTIARLGARTPSAAVEALLAEEAERELTSPATLQTFAEGVLEIRTALVAKLTELRAAGARVVGYGATAKSATVLNFCGIGPDLVEYISDSTDAKQGLVTPGQRIPVRPPSDFAENRPDYALLFAWNHAEEIMAKEQEFVADGGKWLLYVPDVHVV